MGNIQSLNRNISNDALPQNSTFDSSAIATPSNAVNPSLELMQAPASSSRLDQVTTRKVSVDTISTVQSLNPLTGSEPQQGKPIAYGGLTLDGSEGRIVRTGGIIQSNSDGSLKGWIISHGHPSDDDEENNVHFLHSDNLEKLLENKVLPVNKFLPNTITYFQGEASSDLTSKNINQETLNKVAKFMLDNISDG